MKVLRHSMLFAVFGACVSSAPAPSKATRCAETLAERQASPEEFQIERIARLLRAEPSPSVPLGSGPGRLVLRVVVDTNGRAETTTVRAPSGSDSALVASVIAVLSRWEFSPAIIDGCKVKQWVELPIEY